MCFLNLLRYDVNCFAPSSFLQIFLFERFPSHAIPSYASKKKKKSSQLFVSSNIVARTARWIDHKGTSDLRYFIDDFSSFVARPFTIIPEDGHLPHYYRKVSSYIASLKDLEGSSLLWFLFLRAGELPYSVEDDDHAAVLYSPHRVMR